MTPAARSKYNRAYYILHAEERRAYQAEYRKRNRDRLNATRRAKYSLDEEYRRKELRRKTMKRLEDMNMAEIVAHRALLRAVTDSRFMRRVDSAIGSHLATIRKANERRRTLYKKKVRLS